ncbi:unnamed protein product [Heligmosomoides polygyrus]|uniref:HORMA domain-containing protein n=1 Tax=Heligmosomoides polygyrus TaxID=6339 RepID=A0A3P8BS25_HELPZ|nr:unnamed protein product [Heligmosomoides polygyrus]
MVVVISEIKTKEVMERWQFDIQTEDLNEEGENSTRQKDEKKIKQEMSDVIRQITASVTFLPLLEEQCSFDVLIYTGKETEAPTDWVESSACLIRNSEQVRSLCCSNPYSKSIMGLVDLYFAGPDAFRIHVVSEA